MPRIKKLEEGDMILGQLRDPGDPIPKYPTVMMWLREDGKYDLCWGQEILGKVAGVKEAFRRIKRVTRERNLKFSPLTAQ